MATGDTEHYQLQEHIRAQQWNRALEIVFLLLKTQPESSWLHATMGKIYTQLNELKYAETSFKSAIYYHPQHVESHTQLGLLYLKMKRVGSADDHCKQALALDSSGIIPWTLYFRIKLAYSDIPAAKDSYTTIKNLGAAPELLSTLNFSLIRHPLYKEPINADAMIDSRLELLEQHPNNQIAHAQLAYLYNRFTTKNDLAEKHIQIAIKHLPTDPQVQDTAILIRRKQNLWIRSLTAPALALTHPTQIHKNERTLVALVFIALVIFSSFGAHYPWMARTGIFAIIALFFCSYTANSAFQYLTSTEILHQANQTSLITGTYHKINLLPLTQRTIIASFITILAWASLALIFHLITR